MFLKRHLSFICILLFLIAACSLLEGINRHFIDAYAYSGWDFGYRWKESQYVLAGKNPIAVDKKQTPCIPEIGYIHPLGRGGYAPWSYAYMCWTFAALPLQTARMLFIAMNVVLFALIFRFLYREGSRWNGNSTEGFFTASFALAIPEALCFQMHTQNYVLVCLAALYLLVWAETKKLDLLSGLAWALLMIKPQLGILFAPYFLIQKRWKPALLAVCIVSIAFGWVVMQLREYPWVLLKQVSELSALNTEYGREHVFSLLLYFHILPAELLQKATLLGSLIVITIFLFKVKQLPVAYQLCIPIVISVSIGYNWKHSMLMTSIMLFSIAQWWFTEATHSLRMREYAAYMILICVAPLETLREALLRESSGCLAWWQPYILLLFAFIYLTYIYATVMFVTGLRKTESVCKCETESLSGALCCHPIC